MSNATRYLALIDGKAGAYGLSFPDAIGCTAMGSTVDDVIAKGIGALAEWVAHSDAEGFPRPTARSAEQLRSDPEVKEALSEGSVFAIIPLVLETGRPVRANISLDAGLLAAIDDAAQAFGVTRSAFLVSAARDKIIAGV